MITFCGILVACKKGFKMLHKKDYTAIANVLNKAHRSNRVNLLDIANELADYFIADNPNFDKDKFKTAILYTTNNVVYLK